MFSSPYFLQTMGLGSAAFQLIQCLKYTISAESFLQGRASSGQKSLEKDTITSDKDPSVN